MKSFLPQNVGIIATHPLFGPDSFNINNNLKMMMNNTRDSYNQFKFWKNYKMFTKLEVLI